LNHRGHRALSGFSLCALWFSFFALAGCGREPPLHQQESFVFGTRVEVLVYGVEETRARGAASAVLREFDRLHRLLHAWQPSELTALNESIARGEQGIPVSPELAAILADAAAIAASSDQLFNPAIGKLVGLWGFHGDEFRPVLPDAKAVEAAARAQPRMSDLAIESNRVTSRNRAVQFDLGGYAKGYALDRAAAILRSQGIGNALVNIGGNVMALGSKGGKPWRVGIQHPRAPTPLATLDLKDGEAIGTSGDYQRYFEVDGKRYCHLLDPRTGRPAEGAQAATVLIAPRPGAGALSDAASKPIFIAGLRDWRDMARRLGIEHVLLIDDKGVMHVTAALRERLTINAADMKIEILP
jgi:thiamine biosynthesis lipoprotein